MQIYFKDLSKKHLITSASCTSLGHVNDLIIDSQTGRVIAIVVYGKPRLFGLLGHREGVVLPYESIKNLGHDAILVDYEPIHTKKVGKNGLLDYLFEE